MSPLHLNIITYLAAKANFTLMNLFLSHIVTEAAVQAVDVLTVTSINPACDRNWAETKAVKH